MPEAPKLSVLIISYNTRDMTLRCLRIVHANLNNMTSEVLVVDNCSKDGSADAIAQEFPDVLLIRNSENVGFGAANNQALQVARGELFLMVNTDAFLHQGCCEALVNFMEQRKEVGVVGCRLLNEDGSLQVSCFPFPTPFRAWIENLWIPKLLPSRWAWGDYRRWKHDEVREVDWVVGACLVCRREVVDIVGGFDSRFFMYQEETDWQQRIRRSGWRIYFTPHAVATHLGGASGTREPWTINRYFYTSMDKYELKHHGFIGCLLVRLAIVVGILLRVPAWSLAYCLHGRSRETAVKKIRHYLWLLTRQVSAPIPQDG